MPEKKEEEQTGSQEPPEKKRRLRSATTMPVSSRTPVLPNVCIVCKRAENWIRAAGNKRVRDKLVQAETETAGSLLEAALLKNDDILIHIRDKDCVAIEVKYHKTCYRRYVKFLSVTTGAARQSEKDQLYRKSYEIFCDTVVKARVINQLEIFRMSSLLQRFIVVVQEQENIDALDYRADLLKHHLKRDFPQLQFFSPFRRNTSELVLVETSSAVSILDQMPTSSETETETETEPETEKTETTHSIPRMTTDTDRTRALYTTGIIVNTAIKDTPAMTVPWPPTSTCLDRNAGRKVIPVELYNLLAWIIGASDVPTLESFVPVSDEEDIKLQSITQDLVYLFSKGHRQTPKSLCLGLTVRHLTGSSQLLNILNRFGHTASRDTITSYETGLAQLQLSKDKEVPQGFAREKTTILVWDNIDFGEETLSGRGTTHHTNGIMVQSNVDKETRQRQEGTGLKRSSRSFSPVAQRIEPFHFVRRQGPPQFPPEIIIDKSVFNNVLLNPAMLDFSFILTKFADTSKPLPGWTGFNSELHIDHTVAMDKSSIKYLPVIEASPTEMSTVNEIFKRSLEIADRLGLKHIVLVFDQAIYAKAQQIRWKDKTLMQKTVVRLGEFHTCMSFCGVIGKRFADAGLRDILIESEVVAPGSIETVLNGHHYNRTVRAHKLMFEALQMLRFQVFLNSLPDSERDSYESLISTFAMVYPTAQFRDMLSTPAFENLMALYDKFISERSSSDATFALWSSYINMVQMLLYFIRGTRESDWNIHLSSVRMMLPWFFAYDRMNYSRYLPAYWMEMINLQNSHPDCQREISVKGQWTVQRQDLQPFSSIACDQAIEQIATGTPKQEVE